MVSGTGIPEEICQQFYSERIWPISIMLIGANEAPKDRIIQDCVKHIPELSVLRSGAVNPLHYLEQRVSVIFSLPDSEYEHRHQDISYLRRMGARAVVGVCVKNVGDTRHVGSAHANGFDRLIIYRDSGKS